MSQPLLPYDFFWAAGSIRRPLSTSALVLDRQSCRPLLSARPGASHSLLCPKTPWAGESQSHNISFPLSLSVLGSLLFRISSGSQAPCTLCFSLPRCFQPSVFCPTVQQSSRTVGTFHLLSAWTAARNPPWPKPCLSCRAAA